MFWVDKLTHQEVGWCLETREDKSTWVCMVCANKPCKGIVEERNQMMLLSLCQVRVVLAQALYDGIRE